MTLRRWWVNAWLKRASDLRAFEHALVSAAVSGIAAGAILGWLGCYLFHHA